MEEKGEEEEEGEEKRNKERSKEKEFVRKENTDIKGMTTKKEHGEEGEQDEGNQE